MTRKINFNYLNKDFESIKSDLETYTKLYYPNEYNDFSESSVGQMLLELNAYVGDILSHNVDSKFNELFLDSAQNRVSVIQLAKNLGYSPKGRAPSATLMDISIDIPTLGDGYDEDYLITIEKGMKVGSDSGQRFEVVDEINFANHLSLSGIKNRTIIPNYNSSNEIISYKITKTMTAVAGETKHAVIEITASNAVPFFKWTPESSNINVTEVMDVVSKTDRSAPVTETEWSEAGNNTVWYNVPSLPQERVFIDTSVSGDVSEGYWKYTAERFISEYDENGDLSLTFGGGIRDYDNYAEYLANGMTNLTAAQLLNNDSLGTIPQIGTFIHCRYRSGGGPVTNTAQGTISTVHSRNVTYIPGGAGLPTNEVNTTIQSIACNNPVPAIGGRDFETLDEMKMNARSHFSSQDRCVTVDDYVSRSTMMPAQYGNVFRAYAESDESSMNTKLYMLTRDEDGKLSNTGNDQIKFNLASYLKNYKMLNDFVRIEDGKIINIGLDFTLQILPDHNKQSVLVSSMAMLRDYFAVDKWHMNSTIYISQINEMLRQQVGVVNVVGLEFYNKAGNGYSTDVLALNSTLNDAVTIAQDGQMPITPVNNSIKAPITGMFEIKYPEVDIRGSVLT
jgi:hypothetical protein